MATTNYSYHDDESLGDIANKFNTSVLNLVKLNKWLQDPNDGHTFMFPNNAPDYVKPHLDSEGKIDYYEFVDHYEEGCTVYKLLEIVVPLVGNGNVSIEDYWDNVNKITGISYNIMVDNIMSDTNAILYDNTVDSGASDNTNPYGKIVLPEKSMINGGTSGQYNTITNAYIDDYLNKYSGIGETRDAKIIGVDYFSGAIGNQLQSQVNAGARNLNLYKNSGLYRALGSTYFSQYDQMNIAGNFRDKKDTYQHDSFIGRQSESARDLNRTYRYDTARYHSLGNPNTIKGQCVVIINGKTLYMPCYPKGVTDSTAVSYSSQNPLGRSEPYQAYNNSGPRTITFEFEMHREMTGNISEIEEIVRCIESSVYPNYSSEVAAVKASVRIGNVIYISGIVTSQSTNWSGPIGPDQKYNMATVSFTVTEVTGKPKTASDISTIGGFRSE